MHNEAESYNAFQSSQRIDCDPASSGARQQGYGVSMRSVGVERPISDDEGIGNTGQNTLILGALEEAEPSYRTSEMWISAQSVHPMA